MKTSRERKEILQKFKKFLPSFSKLSHFWHESITLIEIDVPQSILNMERIFSLLWFAFDEWNIGWIYFRFVAFLLYIYFTNNNAVFSIYCPWFQDTKFAVMIVYRRVFLIICFSLIGWSLYSKALLHIPIVTANFELCCQLSTHDQGSNNNE